ncbi:MAG: outer membrane protein assembly factor BamD [Bacteroidia bacterium]|nr:MAG: outer membrane protein assembly factor BamD [Bacteroidia bacterium]
MFKNRILFGVLFATAAVILSGCGEYEKLLKSNDFKAKYEMGVKMYEEGEYARAGTLFDQVANVYRGTTKADTVKYYQAKSYYGQRDYMMAGYYFNELSVTYVSSVYLEESDFMVAYCYYKQSPRAELDQETTFKTITAMQMFLSRHPTSDKVSECMTIVTEMRDKLVEKSFISAKLYYDLGYYDSAILALRNSLMEYPETGHREELMFLILRSSYLLADRSIPSKQRDRYQATVDEYLSFIGEFPDGPHSKEAKRMYESSNKFLEENNNET